MKQEIVNLYNQYKIYHKDYIKSIKNESGFINKFKKRLPNILTKSRFIAPFIIIPISFISLPSALITSILFALTDAFDGFFARKFNAYSDYGRIIDPICDKMFSIGIAIPILLINPVLMSITILLECLISAINFNSSLKNNDPRSTYLGKFKTALLSFNLILNYLGKVNIPLTIFTNIIQLSTAINYYKIDKQKDKNKNVEIKCIEIDDIITDEDVKINDIQKQKNELLELKKSLENTSVIEKSNQITKKM